MISERNEGWVGGGVGWEDILRDDWIVKGWVGWGGVGGGGIQKNDLFCCTD